MLVYIGIDPSINSTGICIQIYDNDKKIKEHFFIVRGNEKLTKKEDKFVKLHNDIFSYSFYDKHNEKTDNNHINELNKTKNLIKVKHTIITTIKWYLFDFAELITDIVIVMEGISYGSSIRTRSVFDLAGLSFLIRDGIIEEFENIDFYICPPAEIKKFATGKGNSNKISMVSVFQIMYGFDDSIKLDDISDAWFMSNYGKKLFEELNNK